MTEAQGERMVQRAFSVWDEICAERYPGQSGMRWLTSLNVRNVIVNSGGEASIGQVRQAMGRLRSKGSLEAEKRHWAGRMNVYRASSLANTRAQTQHPEDDARART